MHLATGQQCRLNDAGQLVPVSTDDNGPDGYTDYAIPVDGARTLSLPQGMSGRIYVALGEKLKFRANPGNALAYPAGWVTADPNYPILHDCAEFTYDGAGMHCNTTMVDMLSVPLAISLSGASQQSTGRLRDGGRAAVFSALAGTPGFSGLVLDDLRVIAPGHGLDSGRFAADYFAGYVDEVWDHYRSATMAVTAGARTFTGSVQGDQIMHENTVDGKAYGFAFDDVCEHAPYIEDPAPTSMTVTVTPF